MSDFNDNWQLTGSSDPATPDIQPHQLETQAQPQVQPVFQQPVQPVQPVPQPVQQPAAPVQQPVQQPYQPVQMPAQPVQTQPQVQPQPSQMYGQPAQQSQPVYQQPVYQQAYQQPYYPQPGMQGFGYPAQQPMPYQNADYTAEREKNLNECVRMINHFSPKVDLYQDYEKCKTGIVKYSRYSIAPLVWGIIVCVFGLFPAYSAFTAYSKENIIKLAVVSGVTILIGAGLIVFFILKKRHCRKKTEELYVKLGELSNELNLLYNGFSNCVLPPEFTDPRILFKIQSMIVSGRCVTINNAVNSLLSYHNTYLKYTSAKAKFEQDTAARFDGKPLFFNAVKYLVF